MTINLSQMVIYFFAMFAIILILIYSFYMQMAAYNVLIKRIISNQYKGMEKADPNVKEM